MFACAICGHRYHDRASGRVAVCPFDGGRLVPLPDPLVGRVISGRYTLLEKIGQGGFGVVYRAHHDIVGREVAIKFLLPEISADPNNRERFLREARAANRIDHEHIIDINDFGQTDDGFVFLVMELLEGCSLSVEIARGPLGLARTLDIATQCASALSRAHELDIVHRDVKPDNIHLVAHGANRDFVKLLDFGLAHMKGELRLTATGAVFGTPEYMAPEQGRGAPMTYAADLYALGCVIFEMLSGRPPFEGSTPDLILKHMRETAPRVSECAHGIPEALDVLVARLLEKQPQRRHRDACHLLEELKRIGDALPRVRASVAPRDIARARERRRSQLEGSRPMQAPATWERRAELFEELVRRVHGAAPPPWLTQALGDLVEGIARLREAERRTAAVAEAATKREAEIRALRLRLGRAIDELARDESRTVGVLDDLYRELAALRQAHVEAETTLTRGLAVLRDRTAGEGASRALAATLSGAGAAAARWLEADLRLESIQQEIHGREREREDLLFQVQQLKGRLASGSAEQDHELAALRESLLHLDRDRAALLDETAQRASIISEHFSKFSDIRERGTGQTPHSPNARS
ncbi:MAG: protein kinase domain-containing protein [Deltaproteobacteria bacterium]